MEVFGFSITLLSIVIAYIAWDNGKRMKLAIARMDERTAQMDDRAEIRHKEVIKLMENMDDRAEIRHQDVIKLMERMDERTARISQLIERR